MADHAFKNGSDIHFDYNANATATAAIKKKKKRKSKAKKTQQDIDEENSQNLIHTPHAHLNNPDDDYPTSRVIKQAPNGDVIVERLDESSSSHKHRSKDHAHDHKHDFIHNSIWDSATIEEQENLKLFWESLDESQKMELVRIDKTSIMEIFKNETRASINNGHHNSNNTPNNSQGNPSLFNNNNNCSCSFCGRRSNIIEDELENIYDNHFDDIIDFIHEVRDINDLNALPGLLFGGFHMLEEEHKLQKRNRHKNSQAQHHHTQENEDHDRSQDQNHDHDNDNDHNHDHEHHHHHHHRHHVENLSNEAENNDFVRPLAVHPSTQHGPIVTQESKHKIDKINEINENLNFTKKEKIEEIQLKKALDEDFNANLHQQISSHSKQTESDLSNEQKIFNKLLDPKLVEALENLDFEKMRMDVSSSLVNNENVNQAKLLQKAGSLKEILKDLHKADKVQLEKGMSFLQNMGNIFSSTAANSSSNGSILPLNTVPGKFNDQLTQGLSSFAEDLLKNDGHSFIDMMESLSESRSAREDILKGTYKKGVAAAWVDEDDNKHFPVLSQIVEPEEVYEDYEEEVNALSQRAETDEYLNEEEGDEEEGDDDDLDDEDDLDNEENEDGASDTESEISEEEKMQEIRRLFLIQVIKLFQVRLKNAYKEKLSKDRTQMLIEELEAEENAKKERELKKLKQREKAKEKKKLQQQAKEEEKKRKEEEQRAKEEEELKKQELFKAEQRRRKEEQRLKKEEEKKKRIEELKRKEEDHRKKVEAQIKKEEEAKKIKEERRKKAEEDKKKREEEKKQKELLKKQREEERALQKLQKEQLEAQEKMRLHAEAQELNAAEISQKAAFSAVSDIGLGPNPSSPTKASPSKNHLLEQLYQARPNSIPNISGTDLNGVVNLGPLPDASGFVPSVITSAPTNIVPNQVPFVKDSPSTSNSLLFGQSLVSGNGTMSPWSSKSCLNSISNPVSAQKNLFLPQLSNNFSPFNTSFNGESTLVNDPFNVSSASNGLSNIPNPALEPGITWGQSRNNSIWSTTPGANSIWGNNVPSSVNTIPATIPNAANTTSISGTTNLIPDALVQTAAYNAFRLLQNTNQLEFGVVPLLKLFQTTKDVLVQQSLTLNQFLRACRSSSAYQFDLIYDDFGTVTHIKASELSIPQQYPGYAHVPVAPAPFASITGNGGINPLGENSAFRTSPPPALNSSTREDFLGFDQIGNSQNRGLWN